MGGVGSGIILVVSWELLKVDKAVVDLNGKGLTPAQVQQVVDHIDALPAAEKAKVILLK